ncbi:MAG TPA: PQQ-binding-like beta-propeller repeat protein [Verrucomicrobiae bacterium]|nr:PQQ-binding-like beta-propeller repeat protein [Verrucomicrobiae bacterium]
MNPGSSRLLSCASLLLACCAAGAATPADENWPQWRGPLATGASPTADPPTTWSETSNVKWKVKIPGNGSATPIVWGNRIFIQTAIPAGKKPDAAEKKDSPPAADSAAANPPGENASGRPKRRPGGGGMMSDKPTETYQFVLLCLDRANGNVIWQKIVREEVPHEGFRPGEGSFASASPMTDGNLVFAYFGSRGLYCYDFQGNPKWDKDLGKMQIKMGFGEGSSAALSGNTVVVNCDQEEGSFIVAFDKTSGRELWREKREEGTSWATPLVVQHGGKAQVVTDATGKIRSYDLASGKLLWECRGLTRNVIPSPVAADDTVYCASGFQGNALLAIRLGRTGDLTDSDAIVWKYDKSMPYVPSPLLYGDKLYCLKSNQGVLSCLDTKSGKVLIDAERLEAVPNIYASPVGAEGRIYIAGRDGATVVLKQSDKVEILATNKLDDGFDASPAVVGKELFLRGHEYLYCIVEK